MCLEFKNKPWNFLEVSQTYIRGDVKALFQILIRFFETLVSQFPIDPLSVVSAPSAAFKIWRTIQLPLLHSEGLKVYDFSKSIDKLFRESYCGGIVDVYRPHLVGKGYYYDVNSLYPTAMCRPMPVGIPRNLEPSQWNDYFFGFVEATVRAPDNEYIGLLPIKWQGKLICPGGTFTGIFFSEELHFALRNGYLLLQIHRLWAFQRGENTFRDLITTLNTMKIEAQKNNQPTIRNIAKLLMNSMYGRFGMHTHLEKTTFIEPQEMGELAKFFTIKNTINLGSLFLVNYILEQEPLLGTGKIPPSIKSFLDSLPGRTNVAIAAAVTAYSRMIINEVKLTALNLGLELFYSDTDSLVLNGQLPETMIDSATLGKLKLEYIIEEGIFVMPKVYYLELEDGSIVTKAKGLPGKLSKLQYLELLEARDLDLSVTKWSRSLKESKIQILKGTPYKIRFQFNKRKQIFENGKWVNTSPLIFNK